MRHSIRLEEDKMDPNVSVKQFEPLPDSVILKIRP
jgi:hypothetical protein